MLLPLLLAAAQGAAPPSLALVSPSRVGQPLEFQLSGSIAPALLEFLFLDMVAIPGGVAVPPFGTLFVGASPSFIALVGDGSHHWSVPLPSDPALVGTNLFAQALGLVPPGGLQDLELSNLVVATLGDGAPAFARFAFTAEPFEGTVSSHAIDPATGQWRHLSYAYLGAQARALAAHPTEDRVWAALTDAQKVVRLDVDRATGAMKVSATTSVSMAPSAIVVEPSGRFAYVSSATSSGIAQFQIHGTTGALTPLLPPLVLTSKPAHRLVLDPDGSHLYALAADGVHAVVFAIDPSSGRLSPSSSAILPVGTTRFAVAPDGAHAYAVGDGGALTTYAIDPATGALVVLATHALPAGTQPVGLALNGAGDRLYVADAGVGRVLHYRILVNGEPAPNPMTIVPCGGHPSALAVDPTGAFLFALAPSADAARVFALHPVTGAPTPVGEVRTRGPAVALELATDPVAPSFRTPHVYVALEGAAEVRGFAVDPATGNLTALPGAIAATATGPVGLALHPTAGFALTANASGQSVTRLAYDEESGDLSPLGTSAAQSGGPWSVAFEPSGRFAYVSLAVSGAVLPYAVDAALGQVTPLTATPATAGSFPRGVAIDPTGRFVYVAESLANTVRAFRIDPVGGALTSIGSATSGAGVFAVAVHPSGRFAYAANNTAGTVSQFAIDPTTGALLAMTPASLPAGSAPFDVVVEPRGRFAYVANGGSNDVSIYRIDATTGALTAAGSIVLASDPRHLAADASGQFLFAVNRAIGVLQVLRIDQVTGALTGVQQLAAGGPLPRTAAARTVLD